MASCKPDHQIDIPWLPASPTTRMIDHGFLQARPQTQERSRLLQLRHPCEDTDWHCGFIIGARAGSQGSLRKPPKNHATAGEVFGLKGGEGAELHQSLLGKKRWAVSHTPKDASTTTLLLTSKHCRHETVAIKTSEHSFAAYEDNSLLLALPDADKALAQQSTSQVHTMGRGFALHKKQLEVAMRLVLEEHNPGPACHQLLKPLLVRTRRAQGIHL